MSKVIILSATVLFAASAIASTTPKYISLDMKLEVNGEVVSHPSAKVLEGHKAEITQAAQGDQPTYSIQVEPSINAKNAVQINFVVTEMKNGKSRVVSRPRVVALNHESASIEQKSEDHSGIKLTVTPAFE